MPFLADFIKKWVHFIKKSDVISLVIYQSQPGVFYLKKWWISWNQGSFTFKKWWISWKCALFIKKTTSFYKKKLNFASLVKTQTSNMSFYKKNSIFGNNRDPWACGIFPIPPQCFLLFKAVLLFDHLKWCFTFTWYGFNYLL